MRVVVGHRNNLVLAGMRHALSVAGGFDLVGETDQVRALVELVRAHRPDVVLLDSQLRGTFACLGRLRELFPDVRIVICSASPRRRLVERAQAGGACGVILERIATVDFAAALSNAARSAAPHDDDHAERAVTRRRARGPGKPRRRPGECR